MASAERLNNIIMSSTDTHVHVGGDDRQDGGLPRMWTTKAAGNLEIPVVGKAHFLQFVPEGQNMFGSITLNAGLCPELVREAAAEMSRPFTVWFPSLNARAHHQAVVQDAAWKTLFAGVKLGEPIRVIDDESGALTTQATETIAAIRETKAILATGHLSSHEINILVPEAIRRGVRAIVLTHVSSRHNRLPAETQTKLILEGKKYGVPVYVEHCAITWFDGKPGAYDFERDFVTPILTVGYQHCILSSDCGRVVSSDSAKPITPIGCLTAFGLLLLNHDFSAASIEQMVVTNPQKLLGEQNER